MTQRKRLGILIFDDVEVLDFCGPFEVFSVTRLNEAQRRETSSPFEVLLVAEKADAVRASGGLRVLPDVTTADCPPLDLLLAPGGWGTRRELDNLQLLAWIAARAAEVKTLCSVCTGALLLGKAGLLDGRRATTHWKSLDLLGELFPDVTVKKECHVVREGALFTSAGISAGIDLALLVVAEYHGEAIARTTARHMEYPYPEDLARRI